MAFELIRRKEGEVSEKLEIRHLNVQISINDWGHLVIREFDKPQIDVNCELKKENCKYNDRMLCRKYADVSQCEHCKITRFDDEHLLVFDRATTEKIIDFIFSIRSTYEFKQLLKEVLGKRKDDLPF